MQDEIAKKDSIVIEFNICRLRPFLVPCLKAQTQSVLCRLHKKCRKIFLLRRWNFDIIFIKNMAYL